MILIILCKQLDGYVASEDMEGLKVFYKDLLKDCQSVNNLASLNPNTINNPSIFSILASKYHKADSENITINLEVFLDLNQLKITTYEFTRILGILLDNSQSDYVAQLLGPKAPFNDSFAFVFLIIMMICSGIYGFISKNIKNTNDFSVGLSKEFDNLGYMFILMFFASLLVSVLNWTNLGTVVASWLISFMSTLEFTGLPLIITMFLIIILMSFLIPDAITKWTLASPILVPLFMKANITPDFTQFIFKAADSVGKGITPFFVYFIVMLAFLEKYNNRESNKITVFGTLKLLRPTALIFAVVWFIIVIGFFVIGLPLGPTATAPTL